MGPARWALLAALGAVAGVGACSSGVGLCSEDPAFCDNWGVPGGGAGKGGAGGTAGRAGAGGKKQWSAAAGGSTSAGGPGEGLAWTKSASFEGCDFTVGVPAPKFQLYDWVPCEGHPGCEEAVWKIPEPPGGRIILAELVDDHQGLRVALEFTTMVDWTWYWAGTEGELSHALTSAPCLFAFSATYGDGYVAVANYLNNTGRAVGVRGTVGQTDVSVWTPPPGGMFEMALGAKRFVYRSAFVGARSLDAATGGDYHELTSKKEGVLDVYFFQRILPERFLLEGTVASDSVPSGAIPTILVSDGLGAAVPWLSPAERGEDSSVRFAGSHVGWLRGYGQQKLNVYDKVETWTADLDADGNPVNPRMVEVATVPYNATRGSAAGRGRYVHVPLPAASAARVCELATSSCYDLPLPPEFGKVYGVVGITDTHLWIETATGRRMFRFKLRDVP